jgi:thiosulfate reductase cytochrome b subunit
VTLPRHSVLVRVTHWINTASFLALVISAVAILLAHPRLYWGESGGYGSPALVELPLPLNLDQSGWGRSLHFLGAWICVGNGIVYAISGIVSRHFKTALLSKSDLSYTAPQRWAYAGVIFVLFPLMIATGLAVEGSLYTALGGHAQAITAMAWIALVAPVILLTMVPETAGRVLEEIAPDED